MVWNLPARTRPEHHEGACLLGATDQGLHAFDPQRCALHGRVGGVASDIGAGVRLGHADRENAVARADAGQQPLLDRLRSEGRDDAGLHADLAQDSHGSDVAALGDLLEHQRGLEHGELRAAISLRHGHAENAELGEARDILPGKRAVEIFEAARLEFALGELAYRRDDAPLLVRELEAERRVVRGHRTTLLRRVGKGA
jgi:hypothetical protein